IATPRTSKAAGGVLTAKQAPHRPGTAPALGLRAETVAAVSAMQAAARWGDCHVSHALTARIARVITPPRGVTAAATAILNSQVRIRNSLLGPMAGFRRSG